MYGAVSSQLCIIADERVEYPPTPPSSQQRYLASEHFDFVEIIDKLRETGSELT